MMLSLLPLGALAQGAPSATSLTSSSPTLQLPGSLTLTSVVSPPSGGGVPYDKINLFYDGTNSLGTAPLIILPSTQTFNTSVNNPVTTAQVGTAPFGLFSAKFGTQPPIYSVLGLLDYDQITAAGATYPTYYPRLTIFSGKGTGLFQTSASYPMLNGGFSNYYSNSIDSYGIGDFNHDGIPDVVLHGTASNPYVLNGYYTSQYYVLLGKADGTFDTTDPNYSLGGPDQSSSSGGSNPTTRLIAIDDFNGDGYSDVAYIENGQDYNSNGNIGVMLNPGPNRQAGHFGTFIAAPAVVPPTGVNAASVFLASGITTGHFTYSGYPDVAVVGRFSINQVSQTQGYVQLYHGNGDGTLTLYGTPIAVGNNPSAIVSAKFGQNQLAEVVVANRTDGTVQLLANDGAGGLLPPQPSDTSTVGTSPSALAVADFNSDGSPDILVTDGADGSQRYLLNDKTGHFGPPVVIGTTAGVSTLATPGDFNGDLLPDVATITNPLSEGFPSTSTANLYVNSASSQAVFTTLAQTLPAGQHTLTATYPGDLNFTASTSPGVPVTVTQTATTVTWTAPAAVEYGTPLSGTQLNATASVAGTFVYNPAAGTVLTPGVHQLSVSFTPSDAFDYATPAPVAVNITVLAPTLTGITPANAAVGSTGSFIVQGQGFVTGAQILWNGLALPTTLVDSHHLMASGPAGATAGTYTVTVADPNGVVVTGSQIFSVTAQQQPGTSTISLTTTNASLVRPGSVTLTATVDQPPVAGGVANGSVNFLYDGTNALGGSPLSIIPGTETLPASPTGDPATTGTAPVGVAAVQRTPGSRPVLVSADANTGDVAMYDLGTSFATPTQYLYHLTDPSTYLRIDSVASGYFLQPISSGAQSFVVHSGGSGSGNYAVFAGGVTAAGNVPTLTAPAQTSQSGCDCSNPDQEALAIADYNGDGYSDVGTLIAGASYPNGPRAVAGVAINAGQSNAGALGFIVQAPLPANFCAIAITSGNFNTTGALSPATAAQLAVLGATPASNNCSTIAASDPYTVYLYGLNASNALVQVGSTAADAGATTISASDFNKDGKVDLVIGESSASGKGVRLALGNGDGTFQTQLALAATTGTPTALTTNDLSGDGYPDVGVTLAGPAGYAVLDYDSTTGNFAAPAQTYSVPTAATGITGADLNGDGLADLAISVAGNQQATVNGSIAILLNSASSQAIFVVGPEALPLGAHTLTATFQGDGNFATSTSAGVTVSVSQTPTTLSWTPPAAIEYGTPLSGIQLNATASVAGTYVYSPAAGAVLTPGVQQLSVSFTPNDALDYATPAPVTVTVTVIAPTVTGIAPASAALGSTGTFVVQGQGFVTGAQILWNGLALPTTVIDSHHLMATVPAGSTGGTYTVTVTDPNGVVVTGSEIFAVTAQQQLAASTISLTTTNTSLVRPGSVTLTATVNQPAIPGGVPTGNVNFLYDGTNALGTATLSILPGSESLSAAPSADPATTGTAPVGVVAVQRNAGSRPVLVSADANTGDVAMYDLGTSFATPTQYLYHLTDPSTYQRIDAVGSGYFLQPKSSGAQSFVVHSNYGGSGNYAIFAGGVTTGGNAATLTAPAKTSFAGCDCSNPDHEVLAIDDYNGDGYSDLGTLIAGGAYSSGSGGAAGVAINAGQPNPGALGFFVPAPLPANFCAIAITSGNFNTTGALSSATGAQLAVLGVTPASNSCSSIAASDAYAVYLYGLTSSNALVQVGSTITDSGATSIAAADFNKDGKVDLVIGEANAGGTGVKIALGNGDGTFQTALPLAPTTGRPVSITTSDFSGDSYPDVAVTLAAPSGYAVLNYNSSTGNLIAPAQTYSLTAAPTGIIGADLNLDGLPDLAVSVAGNQQATVNGSIDILLNSASSQATFVVGPEALALGGHTVTATFPGDGNFAASTSTAVQENVSETASLLTWTAPAPIEYGVALGAAQLNATASVPGTITYNPPAGTVLAPGPHMLTAVFTPAQAADYGTATATVTLVVTAPTLTSVAPATAKLGDPDTTITINGQGLVPGAVVSWNGTALATTFVNLDQLTAIVPTALFANAGGYTISVADPNNVAVAGTQTFTVTAPTPSVTATAAATLTSGDQGTLNLSVSPYPAPITATLTITFVPEPPITVVDPTVRFSNNSTTETISIPANSTTAIPPIAIQAGSTAGTITITIQLMAGGVNVTPTTLAPVVIVVPATPPVINTATMTRSGTSLTIVVTGLSSTRDMVNAEFVFKPAAGKSLSITHIIVNLNSAFGTWYSDPTSDQFGTTFTYTQPFTLNGPATDVESATVTLTNAKGSSQPASVQ